MKMIEVTFLIVKDILTSDGPLGKTSPDETKVTSSNYNARHSDKIMFKFIGRTDYGVGLALS